MNWPPLFLINQSVEKIWTDNQWQLQHLKEIPVVSWIDATITLNHFGRPHTIVSVLLIQLIKRQVKKNCSKNTLYLFASLILVPLWDWFSCETLDFNFVERKIHGGFLIISFAPTSKLIKLNIYMHLTYINCLNLMNVFYSGHFLYLFKTNVAVATQDIFYS